MSHRFSTLRLLRHTPLVRLLVATGLAHSPAADVYEFAQVVDAGPGVPTSAVAADVDGDGDLDVLFTALDDRLVAWCENLDGAGSFGGYQVIGDQAADAREVKATDIDGDGDVDALVASSADDTVAWYENTDGQGTFGPENKIGGQADVVFWVDSADLDADGDMDVLSASRTSPELAWYDNTDGSGAFSNALAVDGSVQDPQDVLAADIDGDGDPDVLTAEFEAVLFAPSSVVWVENLDGQATFGSHQLISEDLILVDVVTAGDFDADGDLDVMSASSFDSAVVWHANDGLGGFGAGQLVGAGNVDADDIHIGDLDGDGHLDVLVGAFDGSYWSRNNSVGSFEPYVQIASGPARWVVSADLDGDGDEDVLNAGQGVLWYENSSALFGAAQVVSQKPAGLRGLDSGDLDGDGDLDLVTGASDIGRIAWHPNDGAGEFGQPQQVTSTAAGVQSLKLADLDGDGDLDIASASDGIEEFAWYENLDGLGAFTAAHSLSAGAFGSPAFVSAADLDGDGDLDVIGTADTSFVRLFWFENLDGAGTFAPFVDLLGNQTFAPCVAAGDLDGDGDLDIAGAFTGPGRIAWIENLDGMASFGPLQVVDLGPGEASWVEIDDLDADGDKDLVGTFKEDELVAWYENTDGLAAFGPRQVIDDGVEDVNQVRTADVDSDGDSDVLVGTSFRIEWFENKDGQGTFGAPHYLSLFDFDAGGYWMAPGDFDGDGDLDLAQAESDEGLLEWHRNVPCASSLPSSELTRLGNPPNPNVFLPGESSGPVICQEWDPYIDHSSFPDPGAAFDFMLVSTAPANFVVPSVSGTFLVDLASLVTILGGSVFSGFHVFIPENCGLVGIELYTQGGSATVDGYYVLANALDIRIGTSTAQ